MQLRCADWIAWAIRCAACASLSSCSLLGPPEPQKYPIVVSVESDPGVPLAGAEVISGDRVVAVSGENGRATLELSGQEGQTRTATVKCPKDFVSPKGSLSISLVRLGGARAAEYSVRCAPLTRSAVVVIRAQNGPNLPVIYLGKQIAVTDAAGAAHVAFQLPPDTQFDLKLATDEAPGRKLSPANPVASFTVRDRDDVYVFDQKFKIEKRKTISRPRAPRDPGPTPL